MVESYKTVHHHDYTRLRVAADTVTETFTRLKIYGDINFQILEPLQN